jgi:hypothetical protein
LTRFERLQSAVGDAMRPEAGMPFKSQAQRRKFAELVVEGKISNETYEEWTRETGTKKLPERVCKKPARQKAKPADQACRVEEAPATVVTRWCDGGFPIAASDLVCVAFLLNSWPSC